MMKHWEYEKLFNDDVREKKRVANNIHKRVATRKGGKNSPLRTPYYFMSNKDKKTLNGKVTTIKLKEVMSNAEFKKLDDETQKLLLTEWRDNFQMKEIVEKMGVSPETFYSHMRRLDIPRTMRSKPTFSGDKPFKVNDYYTLTYNEFKKMKKKHKVDVAKIIFDKYTTAEIVEKWGVTEKAVCSLRWRLLGNINDNEQKNDTINEGTLNENLSNDTRLIVEVAPEKNEIVSTHDSGSTNEILEDFFFTFNKRGGDRKAIIRKLKYLIEEMEETNESTVFDIHVTVRGIDKK
ncbi:hypothetical protein [Paenibacillus sp. Mc5Re-14]|uniref:hypothetical protein n=1 Tax=Paenibacillus sp. Mc5Re-14 TaxID=1030529 RepID=UPI000AB72984|nr:hypothetical protein [Paenibacillus sp. Mc5Re-14]